jgi:23S rRNA (adenine2030-N6)-methyltransferase
MLSYRHAFHAGNHADVLKHLILLQILAHLGEKPTPIRVIDTHAGAGRYLLLSEQAEKLGEFRDGIGRLWSAENPPPAVADYLAAVRALNPDGRLRHYPGSPWLAAQRLRPEDRLQLFELHSNEVKLLARCFAGRNRQIRIVAGDGLVGLPALLPPPSRRGLVLIDPSYETRRDYAAVPEALKAALKRFATGVYAIWYPELARLDARQLPQRLRHAAAGAEWLDVSLRVKAPPADGFGMYGSGMFLVNPPWKLADTLRATLPWLGERLAQGAGAEWRLQHS